MASGPRERAVLRVLGVPHEQPAHADHSPQTLAAFVRCDHPDFAEWLAGEGIVSISLNPDTVVDTWQRLART